MNYVVKEKTLLGNPFSLPNDFVEYFYYPQNNNETSQYPFSIVKENRLISASNWNLFLLNTTNVPIPVQVPRLTVSTWSGNDPFHSLAISHVNRSSLGLGIQCYLITNNMACTLLLPNKYLNKVEGLALNANYSASDPNPNQYCLNGECCVPQWNR